MQMFRFPGQEEGWRPGRESGAWRGPRSRLTLPVALQASCRCDAVLRLGKLRLGKLGFLARGHTSSHASGPVSCRPGHRLPQFGPAAAGTGQRLSVSGAQEPAAMAAAATGPTPASEELRLSEGHMGHRAAPSRELSQVTRRPPLLCANAKQTSGGGRDLSMGCDEKQRAVCSRRAGWRGLGVPAAVGSLHALGRDTHSAGCSPQSQSPGRAPCSCESTSVRRLGRVVL